MYAVFSFMETRPNKLAFGTNMAYFIKPKILLPKVGDI